MRFYLYRSPGNRFFGKFEYKYQYAIRLTHCPTILADGPSPHPPGLTRAPQPLLCLRSPAEARGRPATLFFFQFQITQRSGEQSWTGALLFWRRSTQTGGRLCSSRVLPPLNAPAGLFSFDPNPPGPPPDDPGAVVVAVLAAAAPRPRGPPPHPGPPQRDEATRPRERRALGNRLWDFPRCPPQVDVKDSL